MWAVETRLLTSGQHIVAFTHFASDPVRVLHHGNVAQNGYSNAKFLRRVGIAADAVCDEAQALAQPEWEDAELPSGIDGMAPWTSPEPLDRWQRPDWVIAPRWRSRTLPGGGRIAFQAALVRRLPALRSLHERLRREGHVVRRADLARAFWSFWLQSDALGGLESLYGRYDLVQAYATHAILPVLVDPDRAFVAFEHGTLRELPFEDSWRGRLLSVAYRRAAKVIITNADVVSSARRLGLDNTTFVPHPVDETKYTPGRSQLAVKLRAGGKGPILLAPARQDWREKRNDLILRAVAELVRSDYPDVVLLLGEWGGDLSRTRELVAELGLGANVLWTKPVPKLRLVELYRASDVVLDQFAIGTFGATAPEAMACGRPVVMAFDRALHEWCFSEQPPVVDARDERTLAESLRHLVRDEPERERLGRAGRDWVERNHGWRLVADRHVAIYEEVLGLKA